MQTRVQTLRTIFSGRRLMRAAVALLLVFGWALPASAQNSAQSGTNELNFFKNYPVHGDYVVGSVGLRGLGDATGFAPGTITIPDANSVPATGVPAGADIVAAFLYWATVESSSQLPPHPGQNGFFNGHAITGTILGKPNAPTSWSSGGCSGSSQGAKSIVAYRADVRPFLNVDASGKIQGNGSYPVRLADSGTNGSTTPFTLGASLVIIYGVQSSAPLNFIVVYDGAFAPSNQTTNSEMTQTMQGFYQPAGSPLAKITHIVGNGQPGKLESVSLNGVTLPSLYGGLPPFPGIYNQNNISPTGGGSWDSPTWSVGNLVNGSVPGFDTKVTTSVTPSGSGGGCVDWGAIIFSTTVQNTDNDGLLDVWKTKQGYCDAAVNEGVCNPGDPSWVALPGAKLGERDLYIQIDYLGSHDFITSGGAVGHSHKIKQGALDMVGEMFKAQGIQMHVDCGNCYPGDPYVIGGSGGNVIDENNVVCQDNPLATPPTFCQFPGVAATSWKGGFTFLKNQPLNYPDEKSCETQTLPGGLPGAGPPCVRRFQHGRNISYRYGLFAHALGVATNIWSISKGTLISIVVSGATATVTTASPHGLNSGDRVHVSGAVSPVSPLPVFAQAFTLNGTYPTITITSTTTFTFPTASNVPAGKYNNRGLFVESGPAQSISGWADGKADLIVTLGLWRSDVPGDDQVGSVRTQAGTFAHELGHTAGLLHGGDDATNCKSNYQSVMNYQFQVRLLPGFDGLRHVNYSGQALPNLNEGSLNESLGIGATATTYRTRWFAPLSFLDNRLNTVGGRPATIHCDGTPITDGAQMVRVEGPLVPGPIDWNNDGTIDSSLSQDINFNGKLDSTFHGFNDWVNIDLGRIGERRGVFGFSTDVWGTLDDGSGGTLDDGSGGTLDDGTGGTLDDGTGGTLDDGTGGMESDVDRANSTVDPPFIVSVAQVGNDVVLTWTPPGFGQIRTYFIWRADTTNGPISPTNLPVNIGTVTGTPPNTTFTDKTVKNKTTYTYFVTSALGADSGKNSGNQSDPSNMVAITTNFSLP